MIHDEHCEALKFGNDHCNCPGRTKLDYEKERVQDCRFHSSEANEFCTDAFTHHLLKYHDPGSEYYIGTNCVNCIGSFLEKRWKQHFSKNTLDMP